MDLAALFDSTTKLLNEVAEARSLGIETRPVLIEPLTLLLLGKGVDGFDPFTLQDKLIHAYKAILTALADQQVEWVQMDEPMLTTDMPKAAADYTVAHGMIAEAVSQLGADRVMVAPSCSLLHVPHDLRGEAKLPSRVKGWLRFAEEKLAEVVLLANSDQTAASANAAAMADRAAATSSTNPQVRSQLAALSASDFVQVAL